MAPFNTHFLIAERLWPELAGPWSTYYGQFCFGCIAPDVDKLSTTLTQKDTHFFDRTGQWEKMASHRSATFIQQQAEFLGRPFAKLNPREQAFALGYLCHLCVDEVSKFMWNRDVWIHFKETGPGPAFAALDEVAQQQTRCYSAIAQALEPVTAPEIIPRIPPADMQAMLHGTRQFVAAPTLAAGYASLLVMFGNGRTPAQKEQLRQEFEQYIDVARQYVSHFNLDTLVEASLLRSRQRIADLLTNRVPEPDFPQLGY